MADEMRSNRENELVLTPGTYSFVLDETKGKINTLCGPFKTSLSNTDKTVTYNSDTKRFIPSSSPIQSNILVKKGYYVILENPSKDGKQPEAGKLEDMSLSALKMGQTENIAGPSSFALWPGQTASVLRGHHLRTNQYLLARVSDDEAAKANWDKGIVKEADTKHEETPKGSPEASKKEVGVLKIDKNSLLTGQLLIIKGTEVSFYIPPTGLEVLAEDGEYVRNAITLERLEYAILLDEDGNKDYVQGPSVVFPAPTQKFVQVESKRKFRCYELQPTQGIHIKVITDYTENNKTYKTGDELFITGADQPIYFPRPEHSMVSYGGDKHFAIAIPSGEGRYVMDRDEGTIKLVEGPNVYLPNPIDEVMVRRVLSEQECNLYYPGNSEVLEINRALGEFHKGEPRTKSGIPIAPSSANVLSAGNYMETTLESSVGSPVVADTMRRSQKVIAPRTITLDNKYQGAVKIGVWSGFAIQIVNSLGDRRTVKGPKTELLQYDEHLERLFMSKGKPKDPSQKISTVYLKHMSNAISDVVSVKTQDMVDLNLTIKFLVRFEEGQEGKWFAVDNYVQYLVDHMRSLIGNAVRKTGIQEFYPNATDLVRDIVLGSKAASGERPLRMFEENGMTIYDVELIEVSILDKAIEALLHKSQQEVLTDRIELERQANKLTLTKGQEDAKRQIQIELEKTAQLSDELKLARMERVTELALKEIDGKVEAETALKTGEQESVKIFLQTQNLNRESLRQDQEMEEFFASAEGVRKLAEMKADAEAAETRLKAIQPGMVEAMVAVSNSTILEKVVPHMGALAMSNNSDLETTMNLMLKGTGAENILENLKKMRTHAKV